MKILISGAGIAGPAFAHAMAGQRADITIVERASALRTGGQAVDFRGPIHREVLERLQLWDAIHERRTEAADLVLMNERGEVVTELPAVMTSGDVELVRGELTRLLFERTKSTTRYRFGETVTALNDGEVTFSSGDKECFDLVVGADGLHSGIRNLAWTKHEVRHHGHSLATWAIPNLLSLRGRAVMFTVRGRAATISADRALLIFEGERPTGDVKQVLREKYADVGWELPRVLATLDDAEDLYVDQIGTVHVDSYSRGNVALLGDAAWGGTLGGQGTPLAIVGAYVLANELRRHSIGDALINFERLMRPYATECQKGAERAGSFFAPRTWWGLAARNAFYKVMTSKLLISRFEKMVKASATSFELPAYAL
ncbi:MAG: FAD-dependent monooxygenase [Archangium sp.]